MPPVAHRRFSSQLLFDAVSSRSALSGPGTSCQRFAHLQFNIHIEIGPEKEFGRARMPPWWGDVDRPNAFPPGLRQRLFLSGLNA